jgi:glycosyltransferase involved in cell wall biosynthesis
VLAIGQQRDGRVKIAMIAPPWISIPPATYGGTESIIAFIVEELVALGHDVTLFAPGDSRTSARLVSFYPQSLIAEGVPWQATLKAYYHLHQAVARAAEFDVVHTHLSSTADMFLFPLMAQLKTPHLTTMHSNFPFDRVHEWIGDADRYFLDWIMPAPIVTVSERARRNLPYDLNVAGVVHLGVPMDQYRYAETEQGDYFAWLGRFASPKGPHLAIEAARRAGVKLVLAGIVEHANRESEEYFAREIAPHLDGDRVTYIGPVDLERKIALLRGARGLLNPITWEEPGATVVLESMALGCPVISFARGVVPELVLHGKTGFVADTLDEMVGFIGRIEEIDRRAAHAHVDRNFSSRAMAEKYVRIYEDLVSETVDRPTLQEAR